MRYVIRPLVRKPLLFLFLLTVLGGLAPARSEAAAGPEAAGSAKPLQCAADYIAALAAEAGFDAWKRGSPRIEALGPGTHAWLSTVVDAKGSPIGYLVLYAADDGSCRLGEYGLGKQPLFDTASLRATLKRSGYISSSASSDFKAIKHYLHPFAAAWEVKLRKETIWLDAKSAELLPVRDEAEWLAAAAPFDERLLKNDTGKPGEMRLLTAAETTNPYERLSWLLGDKPFAPQPDRLISRLKSKAPIVYVTQPLGDKMLYAQTVVGYHSWQGGRVDLALEMNGRRFVPLEQLTGQTDGLFYR